MQMLESCSQQMAHSCVSSSPSVLSSALLSKFLAQPRRQTMPGKLSSDVVHISREPWSNASNCTVTPSGHTNDTFAEAASCECCVLLILRK